MLTSTIQKHALMPTRHGSWRYLMLLIGLTFGLAPQVQSQQYIVDIDAVYNHQSKPVQVYLDPGNYNIWHIGPQNGGRYIARNAWRSIAMWCIYANDTCEIGWQRIYAIGYAGQSNEQAKLSTVGDDFTFDCQQDSLLSQQAINVEFLTFREPDIALAKSISADKQDGPCQLRVKRAGMLSFFDADSNTKDNFGGVSLSLDVGLPTEKIDIDLMPAQRANVIKLTDTSTVSLAIFGSPTVPVSTIRQDTLTLNAIHSALHIAAWPECEYTKLNTDDFDDLRCVFTLKPSKAIPTAGKVRLSGLTSDQRALSAMDTFILRQ